MSVAHAQDVPSRGPAQALADFAADLTIGLIPQTVRDRAKLLILDALGVGLASNAYAFAEKSVAGISALGGAGPCTVIGRVEQLPVRDAALANGILIHGLDFDDTHLGSIIHATAATLPCALSFGEETDADGGTLLAAYAAGMETAIRVGAAAKGGFHHTGFHATGIVAHFASAIVASRLLGLDPGRTVNAQGIAASTASGVQVFLEDGAWTKRLHPGWAAVAGITAARLAEHGFAGPARPYEGRFGLFDTHLQGVAIETGTIGTGLGTVWEMADTAIKPFPVCHFIHGCADAAISLHQEVDANDIAEIEAFLAPDTLPIVAEPASAKMHPTTDYEAKFSAQFVVANCLVKGRFGLPDLQPEALADPVVLDMAKRVKCLPDPATAFPTYFSGGVRVKLKDGRILDRHVRVNPGAGERALDRAGVEEKFFASASLVISQTRAEEVRDAVLALEDIGVRHLTGALAGRG